ncbi:MAG TPA: family 43 glycosylhydrolase [Acidimicrobiales bacterium]
MNEGSKLMRRYFSAGPGRAGLGVRALLVTIVAGGLTMGIVATAPSAGAATVAMGTTSGGQVTPMPGTTGALHNGNVATDFPDPSITYSGIGNTYYAYSTGTSFPVYADWTTGGIGVTTLSCTTSGCTDQSDRSVARSHSGTPPSLDAIFGLQAPTVAYLGGQWVMYYAGVYAPAGTGAYAVYNAISSSPTSGFGTLRATEAPVVAQTATGGSTDPAIFISPAGQPWLTWKSSTYHTDGKPAHLWSTRLTTYGTALKPGTVAHVLVTQPTSGWASATIENPQMVWSGGTYYLFYSGGLWNSTGYAEGYTTCAGPTGGCGTPSTHEILSGPTSAPYGPGGGSLFTTTTGTWLMAFHGWNTGCTTYGPPCNGYRDLYVRPVANLFPTSLPSISSFTASTYTVGSGGGTITLTAHATRTVNYIFLSTPGPTGIPAFVYTTSGSASTVVHLPANTSTSPVHYTFAAYATGPYGGQVSKGLGVTVEPKVPVISAFTPTTNTLTAAGGYVHFTVGITGETSYSISASPSLPGLPTTSTTIEVPPNTGANNVVYTLTLTATNASGSSHQTAVVDLSSAQAAYASPTHANTVVLRNLQATTGQWSETDLGGDAVAAGTTPKAIDAQGTEEVWFNDASDGDTMAVWYFSQATRAWSIVHLGGDALAPGTSPAPIIAQGTEEVWFNDASVGDQAAVWYLEPSGPTAGHWVPYRPGGDALAPGTSPAPIIAQGTEEVWFNDAATGGQAAVWYLEPSGPTIGHWSLVHLGGDALAPGTSPAPIIAQGTEEVWFNDASVGDQAAVWYLEPSGPTAGHWVPYRPGGDALAPGTSPAPINAQGTEEVWYNDASAGNQAAVWFLEPSGPTVGHWEPWRAGGSLLAGTGSPGMFG